MSMQTAWNIHISEKGNYKLWTPGHKYVQTFKYLSSAVKYAYGYSLPHFKPEIVVWDRANRIVGYYKNGKEVKIMSPEDAEMLKNRTTDKEVLVNPRQLLADQVMDHINKKFEHDNVNHPSHYETGKFECIEVMQEALGTEAVKGFCLCNAFKYIYRHNRKNGDEDIEKAQWYLNKYLEITHRMENK